MSWIIDPAINDGYPWMTTFPSTFNTSWYASGDIELPYPLWRIDKANKGFPSTHWIPPVEMKTGWTSDFGGIQIPHGIWRITAADNDGYPYLWWWLKKETETDDGSIETEHDDMQIGGSQSNYPAYTPSDRGGVRGDMDDKDMDDGMVSNPQDDIIGGEIAQALSKKIFAMDAARVNLAISRLNNASILDAAKIAILQDIYGANIYDGIVSCKVFPMNVALGDTIMSSVPSIYGIWPLCDIDSSEPTERLMSLQLNTVQHTYRMGSCTIAAKQAWELEQIEWSLYLPFAGVYPLDIRSSATLELLLSVDFITGAAEWILTQNGQVSGIFKCQIGWDFPIVTSKGEMLQNALSTATYGIGQGLSLTSKVFGAAMPPGSSEIVEGAADTLKSTAHHYTISAPSIGGMVGCCCYPRARLMAKIPKMHLEGLGYAQLLGETRSMAVEQVSECSGFIQCENYRTDLIVATEEEKKLINELMEAGVFV